MMNQSVNVRHITESVCPVCLDRIPARHVLSGGDIYMQKTCDKHGDFSTIIWRGDGELDYSAWNKEKLRSYPQKCLTEVEKGCPFDCGLCAEHRQQTCCVLIEVTERCNLNCNFCFANSGGENTDPSFEKIREWLELLVEAGKPFIHLSGGEPTVRNDLPEIISLAMEMGFPYIQLNTNGLRLGREPAYVKKLKEAGLSAVFMQFDGTRDEIYQQLRGRSLLAEKEKAIQNCGDNHLGIVLVPTIVPGVNADNIGEIIHYGLARVPEVRGIHFQPVSYFGRYPTAPLDSQRITLPEVIRGIESQTKGIFKVEHFAPSGCDHARCAFHGDFVMLSDGSVKHLTMKSEQTCCSPKTNSSAVERNRNFVARRWVRNSSENNLDRTETNPNMDDMDSFIARIRSHGFTITGMAFQDCWNIDLERLRECSLHVLSPEGRIIPFCAYNLSSIEGGSLYRRSGQSSKTSVIDRAERINYKAEGVQTERITQQEQHPESCCEMVKKTEGCLICGKDLIYSEKSSTVEICNICGKANETHIKCGEGHFICDLCHSADILERLERLIAASTEVNPMVLIQRIFEVPGLNMHGPEYHSIVPAVLVAAYQNLIGEKDTAKIMESMKRGNYIKGGGCGYYGTCGACVGAGIAVSVIDDVTPMSVDKRAMANTVTAHALLEISRHGGPRCCKRETITTIKAFMKNTTYFKTMSEVNYICKQYTKNKDCIHEKCPYFPGRY